jgi:predicted nucleotidyltransferase
MSMVSFDTFKKTIGLLEKNGVKFLIFGGFALDGIRGEITREHSDIDIYVFSDDLDKLLSLFRSDDYTSYKRENMYFIEATDLKMGIVVLTHENDKIIAHGNKTLVAFPRDIFTDTCIVSLNNVSFHVAPNEALAVDSKFSTHENDRLFGTDMKYDKALFDQIEIIKIRD